MLLRDGSECDSLQTLEGVSTIERGDMNMRAATGVLFYFELLFYGLPKFPDLPLVAIIEFTCQSTFPPKRSQALRTWAIQLQEEPQNGVSGLCA